MQKTEHSKLFNTIAHTMIAVKISIKNTVYEKSSVVKIKTVSNKRKVNHIYGIEIG